jgi:hypothetical protein
MNQGEIAMQTLREIDKSTVIFLLGAMGACYFLDWDKSNVKSFVTGGVIASWLAMKLMR